MQSKGAAVYVEIDGEEFEGRDFCWSSDIMVLSDQFSLILPAPDGKATTTSGKRVPVAEIHGGATGRGKLGSLVKFYESDPEVEDGAKLLKITGRLVDVDDSEDERGGYQLRLSGYDLGWHLTTGDGPVFQNYRGIVWSKLLDKIVMAASNQWGFQGVRSGNLENMRTRIGPRAAIESARFRGTKEGGKPQPGAIQPLFQFEVGETIGSRLIELAKWQRYLVNVSADGWLQFFQPTTSTTPFYYFHHERADEEKKVFPVNNISHVRFKNSASGRYTRTECWTSQVTLTTQQQTAQTTNPNVGRYHGQYNDDSALPFLRRDTFSDPNQLGKPAANRRAKWRHDRNKFDSWEYRFRVKGHSQDGMPYEPDTIASLRDTVRGIEGIFYVQSVRPCRILAQPGVSSDAGTYTEIVLRLPNLLGA